MPTTPEFPHEQSTSELRQVRHVEQTREGHTRIYYTIQRKWRVQSGPSYWGSPRQNKTDLNITSPEPHSPNGARIAMDTIPVYCPSVEEWRDLPSVDAPDNYQPIATAYSAQ